MNAGSGKSRNLAEILGNPTRAGPVLAPHNGPGTFPCKCYELATFIGDRFHILRRLMYLTAVWLIYVALLCDCCVSLLNVAAVCGYCVCDLCL